MKILLGLLLFISLNFANELNLSEIPDELLPPPLLAQKYKDLNKSEENNIPIPPMIPSMELIEQMNDKEALEDYKKLRKEMGFPDEEK